MCKKNNKSLKKANAAKGRGKVSELKRKEKGILKHVSHEFQIICGGLNCSLRLCILFCEGIHIIFYVTLKLLILMQTLCTTLPTFVPIRFPHSHKINIKHFYNNYKTLRHSAV